MKFHFISLFVLIQFSAFSVDKPKTITINDKSSEFVFGDSNFMVLEDSTNTLLIKDILKQDYQKKFRVYTDNNNVPYSNEHYQSTYWIKVTINNCSTFDNWYILESYAPHTEYLSLFMRDSAGNFIEKKSGLNQYFYERDYINKNLVFDLPIRPNQTSTFYLKIHSPKYWSGFDFRIKPIKQWTAYSTCEYFFLGLFYGILLILSLIHI